MASKAMEQAEKADFIYIMELVAGLIHENAKEKGFWEARDLVYYLFGEQHINHNERDRLLTESKLSSLCKVHEEISEAVDGIKKEEMSVKLPGFTSEEEELADAVIRILDYGRAHDLELSQAIVKKMEFNKSREYMHGKKS